MKRFATDLHLPKKYRVSFLMAAPAPESAVTHRSSRGKAWKESLDFEEAAYIMWMPVIAPAK
jgi:hypothetical protein